MHYHYYFSVMPIPWSQMLKSNQQSSCDMRIFFSTFFTETFFHSYLLTMLRRVGGKAKNTVGSNNPCGRDFWLCETMRHAIHSILWQNYKKVRILVPRINTSYMMYTVQAAIVDVIVWSRP